MSWLRLFLTTVALQMCVVPMEPTTGIEPVNLILTKDALYQLSYVGCNFASVYGAGDGIRTRDPQLGRLML